VSEMMDMSCKDFIDALASSAPVPGGGSGVGFGGAMGMALCNMVGSLTIGKPRYADVEEELQALMAEGLEIQQNLLEVMDRDAIAFTPLAKAYSLPSGTEAEKAHKKRVLTNESKLACHVPLEAARWAVRGLEIQKRMAQIGSRLVISDVGCGAAFLHAALIASRLNVIININVMNDQFFAETARAEANGLFIRGQQLAAEILALVEERLSNN